MDLLYSRYANPMELISLYINRGRFGEFVHDFLESEYNRLKDEAEKDNNWKLWTMYIHSMADVSFNDWKAAVLGGGSEANSDFDLTEEGINQILSDTFNT